MIKTIREDYTQLTERASEASFEIRYSKFSMNDFHTIIDHVQALQQALITVSSTLEIIKSLDPKGINLKRHLLAKAEATENFRSFRKGNLNSKLFLHSSTTDLYSLFLQRYRNYHFRNH